ncbi:unnamed protein product [Chondrus crispus]|uniref:Uncharacterized protein n=1 Tax=Chondrus crispus TaxID=2769 RepID=R7QMG9_CHOCR|nr:unnamed protein product [Chondrus crispus]CDF39707.1 unnamed protein product [Chondrus crispus]|eukprot:XP_005710001.1 unnamed protein product [Chondrus crispus]
MPAPQPFSHMSFYPTPMSVPPATSAMSGHHPLAHRPMDRCHKCHQIVSPLDKIVLSCGCTPFHMECIDKVKDEARRSNQYIKSPPISKFKCPRCYDPVVNWHRVLGPPLQRESPTRPHSGPSNFYPMPQPYTLPGYPGSSACESHRSQPIPIPTVVQEQQPQGPYGGNSWTPMHEAASPSGAADHDMRHTDWHRQFPVSWPQRPMPSFRLPPGRGSAFPSQLSQNEGLDVLAPATEAASAPPLSPKDQSPLLHHTTIPSFDSKDESLRTYSHSFDPKIHVSFEKTRWGADEGFAPVCGTPEGPSTSTRSLWNVHSSSLPDTARQEAKFSHHSQPDEDIVRRMPSVPKVMPRSPSPGPKHREPKGREREGSYERAHKTKHEREGGSGQHSRRRFATVRGTASFQPQDNWDGEGGKPDMILHVKMHLIKDQWRGSCPHCQNTTRCQEERREGGRCGKHPSAGRR